MAQGFTYPPAETPDSSSGNFLRLPLSDTEQLPFVTKYIYSESAGAVNFVNESGLEVVIYVTLGYHPIRTNQIKLTGTSASMVNKMVGFY